MSVLKELTAELHKEAETQPFIKTIFAGNVSKEKYVSFLFQKYMLYSRIEKYGTELNLFDGIENIKRTPYIIEDIEELSYFSLQTKKSTETYLKHIDAIKDDSSKLMSHIYVHHMGDMFGGQMLAKLVPGSGKMYKFNDTKELITNLKSKLNISMALEANLAFAFTIEIIKEYN